MSVAIHPARVLLWLALPLLAACGPSQPETPDDAPRFERQAADTRATYLFAIHPLHNPQKLHALYQPLMEYLEAHIPDTRFQLEASRDYAAFEEKLYARKFHFALPNPFHTMNALRHGYRAFGMAGDPEDFYGIFLVRRDSGIDSPADLRGKAVSFPAPTALAAAMLPQYFLHEHGLEIDKDYEARYVGSQESSIVNVLQGHVAAGATWPPPWRSWSRDHPGEAAQLKLIWRTQAMPNNGLVVRDDVPPQLAARVAALLLDLHNQPKGRAILERMETARFHPADDATYRKVAEFVAEFEARVRPAR